MGNNRRNVLPLIGGGAALLVCLAMTGCNSGDDNSPSMGKVPPKPNLGIASQLPPEIRQQMSSQARPGADAEAMSRMHHPGKP